MPRVGEIPSRQVRHHPERRRHVPRRPVQHPLLAGPVPALRAEDGGEEGRQHPKTGGARQRRHPPVGKSGQTSRPAPQGHRGHHSRALFR